ncbi:unnamed protein product, partial [Iphiclides podalirius]
MKAVPTGEWVRRWRRHVYMMDRYYTALYRKLTSAEIFNTNHSALLFSLLYKSLKRDGNIERVTSFVKRLLQISCCMAPAQACGMLFLISQVLKDGAKKQAIKLVWSRSETKEEIKEEETETQEGADAEVDETLDTSAETEVKEDEEKVENKKIDLLRGDKRDLLLDDDEEAYVDLKIDEEGNVKPRKRRGGHVAGWHHARVKAEVDPGPEGTADDKEATTKIQLKRVANMDKVISEYNPHVRNPSFAGASCSAYLELLPLSKHFHPTVKLFAQKLLSEQIIQYSGDPLKDFAGIRFLDRFVFKNPKRRSEVRQDGDVRKVKGSHPKFAIRKNYSARGLKAIPVTSSSYLNEDVKKIPVDEKFLYDFLQRRRAVRSCEESDSDADSVTSEDFNKYLDSVTGAGAADDFDEELDYLAEMEASKQKRGAKKNGQESDDQLDGDDDVIDDGDDDDDDDVIDDGEDGGDFDDEIDEADDAELDMSGDEDEPTLSANEDELQLEDSNDEDTIDVPGKKTAKGKPRMKLKGKDDLGSLFASAEEFSTLLEETATNKSQGSSQAVANTDNASKKQLAWEEKRDRWIKGYNRKILGNKKTGNKKFNGKRNAKGNSNMADKKKGGKRKAGREDGAGGKRKKVNK